MVRTLGNEHERVLIIGGGLGGLALAHGLKNSGVPFRVYEQDPSPYFRAQGYRLKINLDGAMGLKSVLSAEQWQFFERTCAVTEAGETDFNAVDGSIIASRAGAGARGGMPTWTCDRTVLRNLLIEGLDEGEVQYAKRLRNFTIGETGVTVDFEDGTSEQGAFLVGADGVRSMVRRKFLPDHKPVDTNGSCIYGKTLMSTELLKRFPARANRWMTLVLDRTPLTQTLDIDETPLTLLLEPIRFRPSEDRDNVPADYVYWVLIARTSVFGKDRNELVRLSAEESARLSLELTQEWDPAFRSLFELQDIKQTSTLRIASAKPNIPGWETSSRVTFLGDAIHAMSPCGGVGAATALRDAGELARIIAQEGISTESIGMYESKMRAYAQMSINRSFFGGKKMFAQRPFEECEVLEM